MADVNQTVNINVKTKGTQKAEKDMKKLGTTTKKTNSMFGALGTTFSRLVPTVGLVTGAWKLLNDAIASSTQLTIEYQAQLAGFSTIYNDLVAGIADVLKETQEADEATKSWAGSLVDFFGLVIVGNKDAFSDYSERVDKAVQDTRELLNLQREARGLRGDRQVTRADIATSITELQALDKESQEFTDSLVLLDIQLKEFADQTRQLYDIELEALGVALDTGKFDLDEYNVRVRELEGRYATLGRESEELIRQYQNFVKAQKAATTSSEDQADVLANELSPAAKEVVLWFQLMNEEQEELAKTAAAFAEIEGLRLSTTLSQNVATRESIELEKEKNETLLGQLGIIAQLLSFIPGVGSFLGPILSVFSTFNSIASVADVSTGSIFSAITRQRNFGGPLASQGLPQGVGPVLVLPDIAASLNNFNVQQTQSRL